jgi:4-hydroxybenzoate polyprenyltransferase
MKFSRLWQPRQPMFWMMVMFNVLSSVCSWAMRALPLNTLGLLLVGFVALFNVGFGLVAAWKLLQMPKPGE